MKVGLIGLISDLEEELNISKNPLAKKELQIAYLMAVESSIDYSSSCIDSIMKECIERHSISYLSDYASLRFGKKGLKKLFGENERQRNDMIKNTIYGVLDQPNICKILENAIKNKNFSEIDKYFLDNAKISD